MDTHISLPSCRSSEDTPPGVPGQQDGGKHLSLLLGVWVVKLGWKTQRENNNLELERWEDPDPLTLTTFSASAEPPVTRTLVSTWPPVSYGPSTHSPTACHKSRDGRHHIR